MAVRPILIAGDPHLATPAVPVTRDRGWNRPGNSWLPDGTSRRPA